MTFSKDDLPRIKGTLIALLVAIAIGTGTVLASANFLNDMRMRQTAADRQRADASNKLLRVQQERDDIQVYYAQYQDLVARGVIGDENRLEWVEGIETIREKRQLFGVKYVVAPQRDYNLHASLPPGNFDMNVSNMSLQFSLLHEGQLLNFFDDLRSQVKGMYLIDYCSIERLAVVTEIKYAPQLKAECSLGWITLKEKAAR